MLASVSSDTSFPAIPDGLPGAELIREGLDDLHAGRPSTSALLVSVASQRLRAAGVDVPAVPAGADALLYRELEREDAREAPARYNALRRRLVSFCEALEHYRARRCNR